MQAASVSMQATAVFRVVGAAFVSPTLQRGVADTKKIPESRRDGAFLPPPRKAGTTFSSPPTRWPHLLSPALSNTTQAGAQIGIVWKTEVNDD